MQGSVAYWTLKSNYFGTDLTRNLSHHNGFICVDLHAPTSVANICDLRQAGANVFLHMGKLAPRSAFAVPGLPPHLLHSKLLVFNFQNSHAEIWVGSHNWTERALLGINVDASTILHVKLGSDIHMQVTNYLNWMKDQLCKPVLPHLKLHYEALQGQPLETVDVIWLEGEFVGSLSGQAITVFGTDMEEASSLNRVGRGLKLEVTDSGNGAVFIYDAQILQSGRLDDANPRIEATVEDISFGNRRFAFRASGRYSRLESSQVLPSNVISQSKYFVTIGIDSQITGWLSEPAKSNELWENDPNSALEKRLANDEDLLIHDSAIKRLRFQKPRSTEFHEEPNRYSLDYKRALEDQPLIRKMHLNRDQ